ncbi:MAG: hypothetical protein K2Z81_12185 [Cyanobacteria bacterium]|nr:hypothetical protein [Cyanobacteriota bacterium]
MSLVNRIENPSLKRQLERHGDEGNTAQGFYIVSADGQTFGFETEHPAHYNNYNIGVVRQFIDDGLRAFQSKTRAHSNNESNRIFAQSKPFVADSTSVVRVFSRISPMPAGADDLNKSIGRDHFWILADELEKIISSAHDDGLPFALPPSMVARMVRFHLVDNVRGEPDMWRKGQVKSVSFHARLLDKNQSVKTYEFQGGFSMAAASGGRGFKGSITGQFDVVTEKPKVSRFRAMAQGKAWGVSRFTPRAPAGQFPLMIAMIEASDEVSRVVPPQAYYPSWPDEYLKPDSWSIWDLVQPFVQPTD